MLRQIAGGGDHHPFLTVVDGDRNHVFLQHGVHADTGIKAVQHQIGEMVVGKQLKLDLGVTRLKLGQMRDNQQRSRQLWQSDA